MQLFLSKVMSSIVMLFLFTFIPFIWWLLTARKELSFGSWLGLRPISAKEKRSVFVLGIIGTLVFLGFSMILQAQIKGTAVAVSEFSGKGLAVLPAVLVYALFNTALPEEILFRGFLLKRFGQKMSFAMANTVQAILFGALHGLMFFSLVGGVKAVYITVFTGLVAGYMGYLNEKKASGSILPSWGIHAISNAFAALTAMFGLVS